jgi:chromosome segregation ATPase
LEQLKVLQESVAQAESKEELQQAFDEAALVAKNSRKEYDNVRRTITTLTEQFEEAKQSAVTLQEKLARVRDHDSQRRQAVLRGDPNVAKIANYIEQHRNEFRRPIYGPIAAEITMKDQSYADYLEFHTPNHVLKAFVVETKDDQKRLYEITTKVLKVPSVMTIHVKDGRLEPISRIYSEQKMQALKRDHGIAGYLDETFTCPDSVLQALRSYAMVHQAIVGTESAQASVDKHKLLDNLRAPEQSGGKPNKFCLFTRGQDRAFRYTVNTSRGGFANMRQDDITKRANMLSTGANPQVEKDLQDRLEEAHREMEERRPALQEAQAQEIQLRDASQEAKVAWTHAKNKLEALQKMQQKVHRAELKLKDAENALKTEDGHEKEKLLKTLTNRQTNSIKALESHAQTRRQMMDCMVLQACATLDRRKAMAAQQMAR